jgi:putative DNA primase/helicase
MDFYNTLLAAGFLPREVAPNGKWYRCATADKPKKKNGAYMLRVDGRRGYYKDYAVDEEWIEWTDDTPVSPIERKRIERDNAQRRQREREKAARAYQGMVRYYQSLPRLYDGHPYLARKGLSMLGGDKLRLDGEVLVWPLFRDGRLATVQRIWPDGTKRNYTGCSTKGVSLLLTRPGAVLHGFAEGFATGLALFQTLANSQIEICLDAGNLVEVVSRSTVAGLAVVCGDNDWETCERRGFNPGVEKATKAAEVLGCGVAYPENIVGSDWADALLEWGEEGPRRLRMAIMRAAKPVIR